MTETIRVLHIGKFYPPVAGGMESFLGDLLPALALQGIQPAALIHAHQTTPPIAPPSVTLYPVPCYGQWLYTPISPTFPFVLQRALREFQPHLLHLHCPNPSALWVLMQRVRPPGAMGEIPPAPLFQRGGHFSSPPLFQRGGRFSSLPLFQKGGRFSLHRLFQKEGNFFLPRLFQRGDNLSLLPPLKKGGWGGFPPWVIHWHADIVASTHDRRLAWAYRLYRPFEQQLLKRSRLIITTSPPYQATSEALRSFHAKCQIIPLGIDLKRFPDPSADALTAARQHWPDDHGDHAGEDIVRLLTIGRLTYYKGYEYLIEAMARLPARIHLVMVGAGEQHERLTRQIAALHLQSRVRLLGFQSDATVQALLATCDALCLPSIERTEAFGLVLLEAMRFHKPVIVSDVPGSGCGWVVQQAGHGIVVPPMDVEALAHAIQQLADHPEIRHRLGQVGGHAITRFTIDTVAAQMAACYRDILNS